MGGFTHLDWSAIYAKISLLEHHGMPKLELETIEGVEVMESAALKVLNERKDGR